VHISLETRGNFCWIGKNGYEIVAHVRILTHSVH